MKSLRNGLLILLLACMSWPVLAATSSNDGVNELSQRLERLRTDPTTRSYAQAEQLLAQQAVNELTESSSRHREQARYMANRQVQIAETAAALEAATQQLSDVRKDNTDKLRELNKRDAAAAQQARERAQLEALMAAEQTDRLEQAGQKAQAQAAQASRLAESRSAEAAKAREEAKLAREAVSLMRQQLDSLTAEQGSRGMQMTIGGEAFASGQTALRPEAKGHLDNLIDFVQSQPSKPIRVIGYTDSTGSAEANRGVSLQRANSVANALIERGVDRGRISTHGEGANNPVASNADAAGRAKNRRVVITLED